MIKLKIKQLWLKGLVIFLFVIPYGGIAQQNSPANVVDTVLVCFENHDALTIIKHMNNPVDIKIDDKKGIYSLNQAEVLIKDFFREYPFISFTRDHSSQSGNEMSVIGTYKSKEATFRLYFLLKKNRKAYKIYQFYIEKS